jgi:hypothetical protein
LALDHEGERERDKEKGKGRKGMFKAIMASFV